jgi:hypothetical protein
MFRRVSPSIIRSLRLYIQHQVYVIYTCSKTNQKDSNSNLLYFETTLYLFWTVSPFIIRSLRLYIQHHTIQVLWLLTSKQQQNLYGMMLYVQT